MPYLTVSNSMASASALSLALMAGLVADGNAFSPLVVHPVSYGTSSSPSCTLDQLKSNYYDDRRLRQQQLFMTISDPTEENTASSSSSSYAPKELPSFVQSPVLQQVYPAMIEHLEQYGNPNIPLGTTDGKKCKTLRRLAFQNKLTQEEVDLLSSIHFRFNDFEDVYTEADFDECLQRLLDYEAEFQTGYQIPKKYKPDPELGAWVTLIRRIGKDNIDPERRQKLDEIGFAWVSTRKCGSAFMKNFRPLKERLEECAILSEGKEDGWEVVDQDGIDAILAEEDILKWIRAQKDAAAKGNLSEARCEYLDRLPGFNWREI